MDALKTLLGSPARARLLAHFVVHPTTPLHQRALQRHTGLALHSLQNELTHLEALGLITRQSTDGRESFTANVHHRLWPALHTLVSELAPLEILRHSLQQVSGVRVAFVFGSFAAGTARPDSDIDVLVYGDEINSAQLGASLSELNVTFDRPLDVKVFDTESFIRAADPHTTFLSAALSSPRQWLIGTDNDLPRRGA